MTKLEISVDGKIESYHLPVKWDEVSIKQYQDLMVINENKDISSIEVKIKSISILTGCDMGLISKAPMSHLNRVYDRLASLTAEMPNKDLRRVIEIEGVEYGFIPDMKDLTFGEFADIDTWMQDGYRNLVDILSVLYRPVVKRNGDRYKIEEYKTDDRADRADLFARSMSIDSVYGAMLFFYTIGEKHIETTKSSLETRMQSRNSMEQKEKKKKVRVH